MTAILFHVLVLNLQIDTVQKEKCKCLLIFICSCNSYFHNLLGWLNCFDPVMGSMQLFVLQSYRNSHLIRLYIVKSLKIQL